MPESEIKSQDRVDKILAKDFNEAKLIGINKCKDWPGYKLHNIYGWETLRLSLPDWAEHFQWAELVSKRKKDALSK